MRLLKATKIHIYLVQSDVNTVTFADESGNLIYSGSDDNLCKVKRFFLLDYLLHILETVGRGSGH